MSFISMTREVERLRYGFLTEISRAARDIALEPNPISNDLGDNRAVAALNLAMSQYEALLRASHASTQEFYAERDLPEDEKDTLTGARHWLKVVNALYGPKER